MEESQVVHGIACLKLRVFCFAEVKSSTGTRCRTFRNVHKNADVTANLRLEKGHDIDAACGHLRLKQETAGGIIISK